MKIETDFDERVYAVEECDEDLAIFYREDGTLIGATTIPKFLIKLWRVMK